MKKKIINFFISFLILISSITVTGLNLNIEKNDFEEYDMLILTTNDLKNGFFPLSNAHNNTGIRTKIKTLNDVGGNTPEAIKDFIKNEYLNNNIEYVLLGGDHPRIPVKFIEPKADYKGRFDNIATDQWYANLDDNNELGMGEIAIGRACVDTAEEVENFVFKTINYINDDKNNNYKVLMVGENLHQWFEYTSWGGNYMDELIDGYSDDITTVGIPSDKYSISKLYDRDYSSYWPGDELRTELNDGVYIVNHLGHARRNNVMHLNKIDIYHSLENKPFFIYSQGCDAGGFDNDDPNDDSVAEYMVFKTNYSGAFAGIFNTRYGVGNQGDTEKAPSQLYNRLFWDAVFDDGVMQIGKAHQISKNAIMYDTNFFMKDYMEDVYWELNLLGDPAINITIPEVEIPKTSNRPVGVEEWAYKIETEFFYPVELDDSLEYKFTWGDGSRSDWLAPDDAENLVKDSYIWNYNNGGKQNYLIRVKVRNTEGIESPWSDGLLLKCWPDPYIEITQPARFHKYRNNKDVGGYISIDEFDCLIIGWVNVTVCTKNFTKSIDKIEFYLDGNLEHTDFQAPYYWIFRVKNDSCGTIKVVLHTEDGTISDSIHVETQKSLIKSVSLKNPWLNNFFNNHPLINYLLQKFLKI
jgi:hypothetical protein